MEPTCTVSSVCSRVTDSVQPANGRLSAACSPLSPSLCLCLSGDLSLTHTTQSASVPPFHFFSCFLWHATQHRHLTVKGENASGRCYLFSQCLTKTKRTRPQGRCSWLCCCLELPWWWGSDLNKDAILMSDSF